MNSVKRMVWLLMLSVSALLVHATAPRGASHAQTADHSSMTDSGETTLAKIARAMSAGPANVARSSQNH